jgi:N utilization substance protein A
LSPTKVVKVVLDAEGKRARVVVPEDQLSVAIGKGGQNVRLASRLSGVELDIEADKSAPSEVAGDAEATEAPVQKSMAEVKQAKKAETVADAPKMKLKRKTDMENSLLSAIDEHGE